jgi:hypothetical protein
LDDSHDFLMVLTFISDSNCCFFVLHSLVYFQGIMRIRMWALILLVGHYYFPLFPFAFFFVNLLDNVACVGVGCYFLILNLFTCFVQVFAVKVFFC